MPAATTSGSNDPGEEDVGVTVSAGITLRKVLVFLGYASMFGLAIFTAVALATGLVGHGDGDGKGDDPLSPSDDACRVFCSGELLRQVQVGGRGMLSRLAPLTRRCSSWRGFSMTARALWTRR